MARTRGLVRALKVALLGERPMDQSNVAGRAQPRLAGDVVELGEPTVDHSRLRLDTQVVDGELAECPAPVEIGPAADLEDQGLPALARERAEVVVQVVDEFEVHERLGGRTRSP